MLVTGASRGIGAAAALALGKAGATVVLIARDGGLADAVAQSITALGATASAAACDVADYGAVQTLVERTRDRHGRIDALVNNAGVIEPIARIADSDPAGLGAQRRDQPGRRLPHDPCGAAAA